MKNALRLILVMGMGAGLVQVAVGAGNQPPPPGPAPAPAVAPQPPQPPKLPEGFKDQKEFMSYAIGMTIGKNIKQGMVELDLDVLAGAAKDVVAGHATRLNETNQMMEGIRAYQTTSQSKREEERLKLAEINRKKGEAFLAENKKKEGVKTHLVTLRDGKTAEMQYKVITEGTGAIPKSNDMVTVTYRGTTIAGKEFDNSARRGPAPAKFMASHGRFVGWSEAWQMMKAGSKWELYIPSTLAGNDFPLGPDVEPGSTVIYEMELTGIEAPTPPAPAPAPLTSDIIRVPSREELQKGAQPEIIKAEDVEKRIQNEKKEKK